MRTGAWCYYNNDPANGAIYGKLYNWYAVNDPRGLAPAGWHIPSNAEWTILEATLGGKDVAGGQMKEAGTLHWTTPNVGATNSSGFTGLPGSFRDFDASFSDLTHSGKWWSATGFDYGDLLAGYCWLSRINSLLYRHYTFMYDGFSVRCVKD